MSTKRLDVLTGLRGIAAYSVLIAHAVDYGFKGELHRYTASLAYFSMSLFFILSGFVIYYNYQKIILTDGVLRGGYRFIITRFIRLYPLYLFGILLSLGFMHQHIKNHFSTYLYLLTMTQSWFNFQGAVGSNFGQSWSISTEWFFYFAFVFLITPLSRIKNPKFALTILIISTITFLSVLSLNSNLIESFFKQPKYLNINVSASTWLFLNYFSPYFRIFEFICGMLAAMIYIHQENSPILKSSLATKMLTICFLWVILVIVFSPSIAHFPVMKDMLQNFIFAPALAPAIAILCIYENPFTRLISKKTLIFCGEISYSVYILQFAVMPSFSNYRFHHNDTLNSIAIVIIIIAVNTLIGYGSYLLIEKPSQKWLKNKLFQPRARNKVSDEVVVQSQSY